uniref:Uncharacterized protein n=1 Tax=Tanacetum cinerariifolium TaxID=118510 RepID=A0A6L2KT09_TANCI|nr:hypothetical protein [Tanacetum cinerariifolium]
MSQTVSRPDKSIFSAIRLMHACPSIIRVSYSMLGVSSRVSLRFYYFHACSDVKTVLHFDIRKGCKIQGIHLEMSREMRELLKQRREEARKNNKRME